MTSQAERRASTINAIVRAARELFTAGFTATSIDDIGARAGVAKGAVYHHFESKEQILARLFEEMTAALAVEVASAAAAGTSILDSVKRGTLTYLTLISGDRYCQVLLIDGPAALGWDNGARLISDTLAAPCRLAIPARGASAHQHANSKPWGI